MAAPMDIEFSDLVVFTRDGKGGNPLAVVEFGDAPSDRWQEVATAVGYSETVFVERGPVATVHIYTPARRLPFAGHPLVGTAHLLGPGTTTLRYDAGVAEVAHRGGEVFVTVSSGGPVGTTTPPDFAVWARVVEMPIPYLVAEAEDLATVAALTVDDVADHGDVYVWAWEDPHRTVRARFFARDLGVVEDAATGSAAVALARSLDQDTGSLTIHQGEEMGRPSLIRLAWNGERVTIGGFVADAGTATIHLE